MKKVLVTLLFAATFCGLAGCSAKSAYGGMIGAGIGGLLDELDDD